MCATQRSTAQYSAVPRRCLTLDTAYNHTKFDDSSFSCSRDILGGVKF